MSIGELAEAKAFFLNRISKDADLVQILDDFASTRIEKLDDTF